MLPTPAAGAVGGFLAAAAVVALAAALGDADAPASVGRRSNGERRARAVAVAAYLAYGVVAGSAFGALGGWFDPLPAVAWLLAGLGWGVGLWFVGVGYRVAVGSGRSTSPLRRALGYDLVFGVVLGVAVAVA